MQNNLNTHQADIVQPDISRSGMQGDALHGSFEKLAHEISKVIVGNHETIDYVLMAVLCNGHVLLEGVPGVAKTTLIKAVAQALGLDFKRIQFTPDLLPSDVLGTPIFNQKIADFETKKGPIFTNIVLADEINRAPAKVQSALLEAMQEQQVTIGNETFMLDKPFLVFATQNPIEQEGTYRLPEAQVDRFLLKLIVRYPTIAEEKKIIMRTEAAHTITPVLSREEILQAQQQVAAIHVDEKIIDYIVSLVFATRSPQEHNLGELKNLITCGASPRASLALHHAARACAFLRRRNFVIPDDVKAVAHPVLRHRISLSYQAEAAGMSSDAVVDKILATVKAP